MPGISVKVRLSSKSDDSYMWLYKRIPSFIPTGKSHRYLGFKFKTVFCLFFSVSFWATVPFVKTIVQMVDWSLFGRQTWQEKKLLAPQCLLTEGRHVWLQQKSNVPKEPENPEWQRNLFGFSSIWKSSASPTRLVLTTSQSQNSLQNGIMPNWTFTNFAPLEAWI